jgi:hypothetical protein
VYTNAGRRVHCCRAIAVRRQCCTVRVELKNWSSRRYNFIWSRQYYGAILKTRVVCLPNLGPSSRKYLLFLLQRLFIILIVPSNRNPGLIQHPTEYTYYIRMLFLNWWSYEMYEHENQLLRRRTSRYPTVVATVPEIARTTPRTYFDKTRLRKSVSPLLPRSVSATATAHAAEVDPLRIWS